MAASTKKDKKTITKVQGSIDYIIKKYNLISPNDRIAIGLSGGADSLVLLENLARIKKYFFPTIELVAIHINLTNIPYKTNKTLLKNICNKLNIRLLYIEKEIPYNKEKIKNNPCFICSWNRRKILYKQTKIMKFNKLALGHNLNDNAQTFLLNLLYNNSISALPYKLRMFNGRLEIIRPLLELPEHIIREYAKIKNLEIPIKKCEYDQQNKRKELTEILDIMKKYVPNPEIKILKALKNIKLEYLPTE